MRFLPWLVFGVSAAFLAGVFAYWTMFDPDEEPDLPEDTQRSAPLLVHAAPALRDPLLKAAAEFERTYGIRVQLQFNPSETIVSTLKITREGDLIIPADESFVAEARRLDLVEQDYPLAQLSAVVLVRQDFPIPPDQPITWDTFLRRDSRLVLPNLQVTAIGILMRQRLAETELLTRMHNKSPSMAGTVTEAASAVRLGGADWTIVWDAVANQYPTCKSFTLPFLDKVTARVQAAVCKNARSRTEARWFAEYLAGLGQTHFRVAGYAPAQPEARPESRSLRPGEAAEVVLYAGSMLRPAIEETIQEFEKREGIRVTRVYNGCGILVAQMRAGRSPDVYLACDSRFMGEVADLFHRPEVVSNNQLVLAVPRGNPHGLKELKDLGKEGLRVGVGHEQQCALGAITKETFIQSGVYAAVRKNVKVESPTGDLLVNQLLTGALDVVVCYTTNVTPNLDQLDQIPILGIPCSAPDQPVAIARGSTQQELAAKLIEYIRTAESRSRFEKLGFGWGAKRPMK